MPAPFVALPSIIGRNGWDEGVTSPDDLAQECLNLDPYEGGIAEKRGGVEEVATDGGGSHASWDVASQAGWDYAMIFRTTPGQLSGPVVAQSNVLVAFGAIAIYFVIASTGDVYSVAYTITPTDTNRAQINGTTINGWFYFAVKVLDGGGVVYNRLHRCNPGTFSANWTNIQVPAAATVANTGAGAYPATLRYYRIAWIVGVGARVTQRSNLGPSVSFTPSGGGTHARITQPNTATAEDADGWEIYASPDDTLYYYLAEVALATTTYDDNTTVANYALADPAPLEGQNTPFPSVRFIISAFNRLIGFGRFATTAGTSLLTQDGTVYFSPPRGDLEDIDVEQVVRDTVDEKGWLHLDENNAGTDRAIAGPLDNAIYCFKDHGIYGLTPTGIPANPFRVECLTKEMGAVSHHSTIMAEDQYGNPALYFLNPADGLRRISRQGIEWCGKDVIDVWEGIHLDANIKVAHSLWVPRRKQIWIWLATDSGKQFPTTLLVYAYSQVRTDGRDLRGGWYRWSGMIAGPCNSAALFPKEFNDTAGIQEDVPHMVIDDAGVFTDTGHIPQVFRMNYDSPGLEVVANSLQYQGLMTTKDYDVGPDNKRLGSVWGLCDDLASGAMRCTATGNTGESSGLTRSGDIALTATGSETQVLRKFDGLELSQMWTFRLAVGDSEAKNDRWRMHKLYVEGYKQDRVGKQG